MARNKACEAADKFGALVVGVDVALIVSTVQSPVCKKVGVIHIIVKLTKG